MGWPATRRTSRTSQSLTCVSSWASSPGPCVFVPRLLEEFEQEVCDPHLSGVKEKDLRHHLCEPTAAECVEPGSAGYFLSYAEYTEDGKNHQAVQLGERPENHSWECPRVGSGRTTRWKIENETYNTLKNQGYQFRAQLRHGERNLAVVFAMLMMLAFWSTGGTTVLSAVSSRVEESRLEACSGKKCAPIINTSAATPCRPSTKPSCRFDQESSLPASIVVDHHPRSSHYSRFQVIIPVYAPRTSANTIAVRKHARQPGPAGMNIT